MLHTHSNASSDSDNASGGTAARPRPPRKSLAAGLSLSRQPTQGPCQLVHSAPDIHLPSAAEYEDRCVATMAAIFASKLEASLLCAKGSLFGCIFTFSIVSLHC